VHDDFTDPRGMQPVPQGQRCRACGRVEPDPGARFCGVCGATLDHPSGAGFAADTVHLAAAPAATVAYTTAPPVYPPVAARSGVERPLIYRVPSIGLGGSARIGSAVSAAFTLLPCIMFAFIGAWLVHAGRRLLDSWLAATVPVPVPLVSVSITMNFIELLHLRAIYDQLISWDDHLWLTFAVLWLVPWAAWIVAGALFGLMLAMIYNLVGTMGGGLRLSVSPEDVEAPRTTAIEPSRTAPTAPPQSWGSGQYR